MKKKKKTRLSQNECKILNEQQTRERESGALEEKCDVVM